MVTISSTTNSVIFTFDDNQHYLQNGTIEVPKNALALVVDDSDMVTFKKASSNDIFLSITLEELDMTKEEVISYYQANMVGADGITSGEVQTMIDESISGKADTSAVTEEISAAVSGKADSSAVTEEISAAVSGKADSSAVTQEITAAVSGKADSSAVTEEITAAVSGKADSSAVTEEISAAVSGKADTSALTVYFDDAKYEMSGQTHVINFYNGNVIKATINADDFIKDGMVDSVAIENGYLVITFNTDSGKQPISIPLTDIFDPSNYYTTAQTDSAIASAVSGKADSSAVTEEISAAISGKADSSAVTEEISAAVSGKADSSAVTEEISAAVSGKADSSTVETLSGQVIDDELVIVNGFLNVNAQLSGKADSSAVTEEISAAVSGKADSSAVTEEISAAVSGKADSSAVTEEISAAVSGKQDTLSAGTNITIVDNVISATGGGTVDQTLNSGSTNAVSNSAVTNNTISGDVEENTYFRSFRFWKNNGQVAFYKRYASINNQRVLVEGTANAPEFSLVETSAITTSITSGATDSQVPSAKAVYDQLGGVKIVALSQTDYDNLAPDYDPNTLYIINS